MIESSVTSQSSSFQPSREALKAGDVRPVRYAVPGKAKIVSVNDMSVDSNNILVALSRTDLQHFMEEGRRDIPVEKVLKACAVGPLWKVGSTLLTLDDVFANFTADQTKMNFSKKEFKDFRQDPSMIERDLTALHNKMNTLIDYHGGRAMCSVNFESPGRPIGDALIDSYPHTGAKAYVMDDLKDKDKVYKAVQDRVKRANAMFKGCCFVCGQRGHQKQDCDLLPQLAKSDVFVHAMQKLKNFHQYHQLDLLDANRRIIDENALRIRQHSLDPTANKPPPELLPCIIPDGPRYKARFFETYSEMESEVLSRDFRSAFCKAVSDFQSSLNPESEQQKRIHVPMFVGIQPNTPSKDRQSSSATTSSHTTSATPTQTTSSGPSLPASKPPELSNPPPQALSQTAPVPVPGTSQTLSDTSAFSSPSQTQAQPLAIVPEQLPPTAPAKIKAPFFSKEDILTDAKFTADLYVREIISLVLEAERELNNQDISGLPEVTEGLSSPTFHQVFNLALEDEITKHLATVLRSTPLPNQVLANGKLLHEYKLDTPEIQEELSSLILCHDDLLSAMFGPESKKCLVLFHYRMQFIAKDTPAQKNRLIQEDPSGLMGKLRAFRLYQIWATMTHYLEGFLGLTPEKKDDADPSEPKIEKLKALIVKQPWLLVRDPRAFRISPEEWQWIYHRHNNMFKQLCVLNYYCLLLTIHLIRVLTKSYGPLLYHSRLNALANMKTLALNRALEGDSTRPSEQQESMAAFGFLPYLGYGQTREQILGQASSFLKCGPNALVEPSFGEYLSPHGFLNTSTSLFFSVISPASKLLTEEVVIQAATVPVLRDAEPKTILFADQCQLPSQYLNVLVDESHILANPLSLQLESQ